MEPGDEVVVVVVVLRYHTLRLACYRTQCWDEALLLLLILILLLLLLLLLLLPVTNSW